MVYEVEGFEEGRETMSRMQLLRGAVMAAGIEAAGVGPGGMVRVGTWPGLGRIGG